MSDPIKDNAPCILLVSSSIAFLTLARQYLKGTRSQIIEAGNAHTALEACRSHAPNLIYMSVNLPDPGGVECCRQIKADLQLKEIPVVLVAREKDGDRSTFSRPSNCDAVIGFPLIKKNFLAIGRSFLAGFRERRHACRLPARLVHLSNQNNCQGLDISSSGAFLAHPSPPALGHPIELELQLTRNGEQGPRIIAHGQVVWVNSEIEPMKPTHPAGFGVRFTDINPKDEAVLNGFLKTLAIPGSERDRTSGPSVQVFA